MLDNHRTYGHYEELTVANIALAVMVIKGSCNKDWLYLNDIRYNEWWQVKQWMTRN